MAKKAAIDPKRSQADLKERLSHLRQKPETAEARIGVNITLVKDFLKKVDSRGFSFYCDEPQQYGPIKMGGTNKGPPPLTYFLAGIGCCELSFYTVCATMLDISIDSLEMEVAGSLDWKGPYGLGGKSSFKEFTTTVRIKSKTGRNKLRELVKLVHSSCPAYNTIVSRVPVHNVLYLNGSKVD